MFEQNFKMTDIFKQIDQFEEETNNLLVQDLIRTLKRLVDKARAKTAAEKSFNNITWNLRASIGGVVVRNGSVVFSYFPRIAGGPEGAKNGPAYAREIALLQDDGDIMIIMVAGMDYARFVEAKGKDVITGSSEHFMEIFKQELINN